MREHIRQVTDVRPPSDDHDPRVEICVVLDAIDPPAGRVRLPDGREVGFAGWLGLLQVLLDIVDPTAG